LETNKNTLKKIIINKYIRYSLILFDIPLIIYDILLICLSDNLYFGLIKTHNTYNYYSILMHI